MRAVGLRMVKLRGTIQSMNLKAAFSLKYGPWALVTGAGMGLGAEFARQLGLRGLNLVLADINSEALLATADAISAESRVQMRALVCDLSLTGELAALIEAANDLEIGLLVNNAGISAIGHFLDVPLEKHLKIIDLNARAPLLLAHHFGAKMRARGCGGIIFVSSGSAAVGASYVSAYSATKVFNLNLGEALWEELRSSGVDVLASVVGATDTPGWRAENPDPEVKTWPPVMAVVDTVRETLDALGKTSSFFPGAQNRLAMFASMRLMSRPAAVRVIGAEMRKRYGKK
jgi:short-subunit dehydrogenase